MTNAHPFDLSALTPTQRAITEDAIDAAHVDWMTLQPKLQATKRKSLIPVEWVDLSREAMEPDDAEAAHIHHVHRDGDMGDLLAAVEDGRHVVYGLAWYSGKISIEQTLESRPLLAQEVFLAEGAHMVDFFLMSDAERQAIYEAYHGGPPAEHGHGWFDVGEYRDFVGEAFMRGFVESFTSLRWTMGGFTHMTTAAVVAVIQEQLSELAPPPPEPPPPPPPPLQLRLETTPQGFDDSFNGWWWELAVLPPDYAAPHAAPYGPTQWVGYDAARNRWLWRFGIQRRGDWPS